MGFSHGAEVVVQEVDDENWKVVRSFSYAGEKESFTVPVGQLTDFASVPRVFVWFLPRYGRYTLAAILHDYLWRVGVPNGELAYRDADGIFRRAMHELGVPFAKRWSMWSAVRWAGLFRPGGRRGWLRDAPAVLLTTLLALPFLAPTGALISLALLLMYVIEWLVALPLLSHHAVARAAGKTPKKVNLPKLHWKM
ncbi:MAG TPA: DUF1353 domain-containing protein [Polyangia bacterium]|nr:DUF1353 domain-containing protein [Polyangia bacterium]